MTDEQWRTWREHYERERADEDAGELRGVTIPYVACYCPPRRSRALRAPAKLESASVIRRDGQIITLPERSSAA